MSIGPGASDRDRHCHRMLEDQAAKERQERTVGLDASFQRKQALALTAARANLAVVTIPPRFVNSE